jgi:hypothetical protein
MRKAFARSMGLQWQRRRLCEPRGKGQRLARAFNAR